MKVSKECGNIGTYCNFKFPAIGYKMRRYNDRARQGQEFSLKRTQLTSYSVGIGVRTREKTGWGMMLTSDLDLVPG
jgi:hypothetical protein